MNLSINLLAATVHAVVAGLSEDYDAGVDQAAHGATNWISLIRLDRRSAQAKIQNADVVSRAIRHHPIERAQNSRSAAGAGGVQNPQIDQVCIRSNAGVLRV